MVSPSRWVSQPKSSPRSRNGVFRHALARIHRSSREPSLRRCGFLTKEEEGDIISVSLISGLMGLNKPYETFQKAGAGAHNRIGRAFCGYSFIWQSGDH